MSKDKEYSYQIVLLDLDDRRHIVFQSDSLDTAIAKFNQVDEAIDSPYLLISTGRFQSIELQQVKRLDRVIWNENRGSDADRRG